MSLISTFYISVLYSLLSFSVLGTIPGYSTYRILLTSALIFLFFFLLDYFSISRLEFKKTRVYNIGLTLVTLAVLLTRLINRQLLEYNLSLYVIVLLLVFVLALNYCSEKHSLIELILYAMFLIGLCCFAFTTINFNSKFSPDSYSYYDISRSIFSDFGHVSTIRQYVLQTRYNISFPYLWPLFIHVIDLITGMGLHAGVISSSMVVIATALALMFFSQEITGKKDYGYLLSFFLLTNIYYLDEVTNGRSIPLNILIILSAIYLLWEAINKNNIRYYFFSGLLFGCSSVNRFDSLTILAFFTLVMFLFMKKNLKNILSFVMGAMIPVLPWLLYSVTKIGKIWVTDNGGTMFMVDVFAPNRILESDVIYRTLFNSPKLWIISLFEKTRNVLLSFIECSSPLLLFISIYLFTFFKNKEKPNTDKKVMFIFYSVLIYYFLKTGMYCLVGYTDNRYHLETLFVVSLFCMFLKFPFDINKINNRYLEFILIFLLLCSGFFSRGLIMKCVEKYDDKNIRNINIVPREVSEILEVVNENIEAGYGIVTVGFNGFEFGAYDSNHYYYVSPYNGNGFEKYTYAYKNNYIEAEYMLLNKERLNDEEISFMKDYLDENASIIFNEKGFVIYDVQKCFKQD